LELWLLFFFVVFFNGKKGIMKKSSQKFKVVSFLYIVIDNVGSVWLKNVTQLQCII
jgi:hypothetical protein